MPTTIDEVWLTCKCRQFRDMIRTALSLHLFKHLLWADWLIPYSLLNLSWWIELQKLNHQYIELNVLQCILKTILNNSNWVCETEMPTNSQITFKTNSRAIIFVTFGWNNSDKTLCTSVDLHVWSRTMTNRPRLHMWHIITWWFLMPNYWKTHKITSTNAE